LAPAWEGDISLCGKSQASYEDMAVWRKQVLYVPQTKIDIPGTPTSLLENISSFKAWKNADVNAPSSAQMTKDVEALTQKWEIAPKLLDSEWRILSGGECQRILLAIALASQPMVILLDESTSALDMETKVKVEKSIEDYCRKKGMVAIWITHDHGQQGRIKMNGSRDVGATHIV
jgi:ABC-type glutathione transport system ATPase component